MWHFARLLGFGAIAAAMLALAGAEDVFAQKKNKQPAAPSSVPATAADYTLLKNYKEVFGTIASVSGEGQTIIFRIDSPTMEPNPKYKPPTVTNPRASGYNAQANQQHQMLRTYQQIQRDMQQASRSRTPQQAMQHMNRLQMDMARLQMQYQNMYMRQMQTVARAQNNPNNQPFQIVHHLKDFEMEMQKGAVLRKMYLATEFDDVGNLKEYSEKEKAELRGKDKTLPGYAAKTEDILSGAEAKVYFATPKAKQKTEKTDKDAKDLKDLKDADGVGNVDPPIVRMIVLTKESPAPANAPAPAPKKKNKK